MKNIKLISFILLFIAYDVNATSVKLFGRNIDIPNKYNLFVNESIEHNKFIFRTGDFISGTNNGFLTNNRHPLKWKLITAWSTVK